MTSGQDSNASRAPEARSAGAREFVKFAAVGGLGTLTNLVVFYAIVDAAALVGVLAGAAICFAVAVTQNYVLNELWTFGSERAGQGLSAARYLKFVAASGLGFVVNAAVLVGLQTVYDFPLAVIPQAVGIAAAMALNFVVSKFLVFRRDG